MNEYTLDLDDAFVEVIFAGLEIPEPYFTHETVRNGIERRKKKVTAKLIAVDEYFKEDRK